MRLPRARFLCWPPHPRRRAEHRSTGPGHKIKVGLMLPYTGTFAALGTASRTASSCTWKSRAASSAGREIEYFKVDDESDPAKAPENANKLVKRDQVDVLVGTVHSGVAMGMAKVAKDNNTLLIVPNAGADAVTGPLCAPNVFRSSFSNWQPGLCDGPDGAASASARRR